MIMRVYADFYHVPDDAPPTARVDIDYAVRAGKLLPTKVVRVARLLSDGVHVDAHELARIPDVEVGALVRLTMPHPIRFADTISTRENE